MRPYLPGNPAHAHHPDQLHHPGPVYQIQEICTKVETLEKQMTQTSETEAEKRRRIQDALADMGNRSRCGEDARLAAIFRGML
jgi:hypothetical protein